MHTQAHNLGAEAGFQAVLANNILIDRGRIQVPIKATGPIVLYRPEKSPFDIAPMSWARIFSENLASRRETETFRLSSWKKGVCFS